ncbi:MAG: hypothetical protein U9P00_13400, partial [Pseudomonadota bacterium]|nr:hypothetical protein [Pseudomonadota bacterium]
LFHLHPESSPDEKEKIENELRAHDGILSVHYNEEDHPHAVVVAYNPDAVTSQEILTEIRKYDKTAVMVGF